MLNRTSRRAVVSLPVAALLLAACAQQATTNPNDPATYTVLVGGSAGTDPGAAAGAQGRWQLNKYYPSTLTVNEGDTVVWAQSTAEPHTVTFLDANQAPPALIVPENDSSMARIVINPLASRPAGASTYNGTGFHNSGWMTLQAPDPREYRLTFTKAGTYHYLCLLHGAKAPDGTLIGMAGTVVVNPKGTARAQTPAQVQTAAAAQVTTDQAAAVALDATAMQRPADTPNAGGGTNHHVNVGYSQTDYDLMRFVPTNLTIKVGDTVTFTNRSEHAPHTVTFPAGTPEPAFELREQTSAGTLLVINPLVLGPAGGTSFSGGAYTNSGVLSGAMDQGVHEYRLTFTKAGTYEYVCAVHAMIGMRGTITVTQ
ncbi:plastocyanin/azurin family copper-binding protein [Deinococcus pimensis]|uniref:plastocyanin/azurin family copper-binding protein n=1 Tax=Deinococcus pimensis TaxID=309888 RepID=UPI0004838EE4|nr:plastocyanin/azurin family copper-binding protein [Deinococcus pimensis]